MSARRFKWPRPGVCRVCGCTEAQACPGGCRWADHERMVCSTCAGTDGDLAGAVAWIPRIIRKYGPGKDTCAAVLLIANEAVRRYGKRLIDQEHG